MSFWHNNRYENIEKFSTGDPLRGLPELKFPWLVKKDTFADYSGDFWNVSVFCTDIKTDSKSNKVYIDYFVEGNSSVSLLNLKKISIQIERLNSMGVNSWNFITDSLKYHFLIEFEKIEVQSENLIKKFREHVNKKFTFAYKQEVLLIHIKNAKISKFSE